MQDKLGKGSYGKVIKRDGMAVKQFANLAHVIQEESALNYLKNCQHVVHASNVNYRNCEISMVLYDMSLRQWLSNECCCEACINTILNHVLKGLVELHDRGLSHSDIKPGNILIRKKPLKAVLGDCGFVSIAKYSKQQRTAQSYRDLIVVNDDKHDIYSFGVMFMELIYSIYPSTYHSYKQIQKLIHKYVTDTKHKKLLKSMMHEDRSLRPTPRDILFTLYNESPEHWIAKNIHIHEEKVYHAYGKTKILEMEQMIKKISRYFDIRRSRYIYKAFICYLSHHTIEPKYLDCYLAGVIIVFGSNFGNRTPKIQAMIEQCKITHHSKTKLYQVLYELTNNENFLSVMFS